MGRRAELLPETYKERRERRKGRERRKMQEVRFEI
jgi:hypothetical protein